ncbi:Nodule Cysteine-Rich (NCR) secreted peptide [Medicago truncatula]|uniref:Nodule Cysteine-Rich (NCR) secreted peptide n=1 Tax=Medicago truncatula TaxID=3880 RepID=I3S1U5_MEDTR|nr:unknown [Medicago truncatula]KEH21601.1 Nodule Cysteine-Rich (NCR) secreted peptide [Medicago truncatula]
MVETPKFVYNLILLIYIFLFIIICDSTYLPTTRICITDKDCPSVKNYIGRCRKGYCQASKLR